jgi:hypothetical protein
VCVEGSEGDQGTAVASRKKRNALEGHDGTDGESDAPLVLSPHSPTPHSLHAPLDTLSLKTNHARLHDHPPRLDPGVRVLRPQDGGSVSFCGRERERGRGFCLLAGPRARRVRLSPPGPPAPAGRHMAHPCPRSSSARHGACLEGIRRPTRNLSPARCRSGLCESTRGGEALTRPPRRGRPSRSPSPHTSHAPLVLLLHATAPLPRPPRSPSSVTSAPPPPRRQPRRPPRPPPPSPRPGSPSWRHLTSPRPAPRETPS